MAKQSKIRLLANPMEFDPYTGVTQLPVSDNEGWPVQITKVEKVKTKDGNNAMLNIDMTIYEGEGKGLTGTMRLNLWHTNETTMRIAYSQLCAINCVIRLNMKNDELDPNLMLGKKLRVVVIQSQSDEKYTEIKSVLDVNGVKASKSLLNGAKAQRPAPKQQQQQRQINKPENEFDDEFADFQENVKPASNGSRGQFDNPFSNENTDEFFDEDEFSN